MIRFLAVVFAFASISLGAKVEIVNNQPFPIAMPWKLRDGGGVVMVNVGANGKQTIDESAKAQADGGRIVAEAVENGIRLKSADRDLGTLSWDIFLEKVDRKPTDEEAAKTKRDFDKTFAPIAMKFAPSGDSLWSADGEKNGIKLHVELETYSGGFADLRTTFTNQSAPKEKIYCALLTRWDGKPSSRSVDYDNHITLLPDGGATPFRAGEGRHLFVQRGVDWFNTTFDDKLTVAWLNDFTPSFTVHRDATPKTPAHWTGANTAQLAQEAMVKDNVLYSVTEIARPQIKSYESRVAGNVLPGPDQPLTTTARLIVSNDKLSDARIDELFVGYTSFNEQTREGDTIRLTFGVPYTKFGTAYFPYSTLGENFEKWHMPGQNKTTYWTLSADTVTKYKLFADDIKRDLRIAKAMGFETIRLHHLEEIAKLDKAIQDEYLDFFMGELKHLGLTALLDLKFPPQRIAELVKKYREQVDGVEIDNEVILFGIPDDEVQYWKDCYKAVKDVAPDMPVWLTGHTNTGAFERLRKLGVPFDRVGSHAYMDSIDAIPSARDYSLAVASYAAKIGKSPTITEWNWRFLTRMTPENRAAIYAPIFENVLKARSMPLIYQFQFQESLAMASRGLRGIRHYELLNLSRRPRPEAIEFMSLIDSYCNPNLPQQRLRTSRNYVLELPENTDGTGTAIVGLINGSDKKLSITATAEGPSDCELSVGGRSPTFTMNPNQHRDIPINFKLPADAMPGFYHFFVRLDGGDVGVSYGWAQVRKTGPLKIDKEKGYNPEVSYSDGALEYDFNREISIVYGKEATGWEVESAWLLYQTLESATGRPVKIFQMNDLPDEVRKSGAIIAVGTPKTNELVGEAKGKFWVTRRDNTLIVGGDDEANLNVAAIDLVLRYWKYARDSGARRIPLTDEPINKGADASDLK